jgi:hypothetical protein
MALLNFTDGSWQEVDPQADVVRAANSIAIDGMIRSVNTYVFQDSPLGKPLDDYRLDSGFEIQFEGLTRLGAGDEKFHFPDIFALCSFAGGRALADAAEASYIAVALGCGSNGNEPYPRLYEREGAASQSGFGTPGSYVHSTNYFFTLKLDGTDLTLIIRTGSHVGTIVDTIASTTILDVSQSMKYLYALRNVASDNSYLWHADVANYEWLLEPSRTPPASGGGGGSFELKQIGSFQIAGRRRRVR